MALIPSAFLNSKSPPVIEDGLSALPRELRFQILRLILPLPHSIRSRKVIDYPLNFMERAALKVSAEGRKNSLAIMRANKILCFDTYALLYNQTFRFDVTDKTFSMGGRRSVRMCSVSRLDISATKCLELHLSTDNGAVVSRATTRSLQRNVSTLCIELLPRLHQIPHLRIVLASDLLVFPPTASEEHILDSDTVEILNCFRPIRNALCVEFLRIIPAQRIAGEKLCDSVVRKRRVGDSRMVCWCPHDQAMGNEVGVEQVLDQDWEDVPATVRKVRDEVVDEMLHGKKVNDMDRVNDTSAGYGVDNVTAIGRCGSIVRAGWTDS